MDKLEKISESISRDISRLKSTQAYLSELRCLSSDTELLRFIAVRLIHIEEKLKCLII